MENPFINNTYQILLGIIAGLITVLILESVKYSYNKYQFRKFRAVFGDDIAKPKNYYLVYAQLILPMLYDEKGNVVKYPYRKPDLRGFGFSIDRPVSSCELRAAKYLSTLIGLETRGSPTLMSDYELRDYLDISFISFGGPLSNCKTKDANINEGNDSIKFDQPNQQFISVKSKQKIVCDDPNFDYGLILKIHPGQFPKRTWIICAGRGEWGTSGAAWYLANKWKRIYSVAKKEPFGLIVKVKNGQDESAEPV